VTQLPSVLRDEVIRALYADASRLDWENLGSAEKSHQYQRWLEDEKIGGKILNFRPSDAQARVWIKDGPMKEYSRALLGVGPNARFVAQPRCTPESVVRAALGPEWRAVEQTIEIKPVRCRAISQDGEAVVLWGNTADFKHLLFAALNIAVREKKVTASIAVIESAVAPTPRSDRSTICEIAGRCDIPVSFVNPPRTGP
jgi:hypothetical protein